MARFFDKLFLFLFSLAVLILSVTILLAGLGVVPPEVTLDALRDVYNETWLNNTVIITSFVLLLLSLRFMFVSLKRQDSRHSSYKMVTTLGEISISQDTIENLSLRSAGKVRGVKDLKARVKVTEQGLDIALRIVVDGVHAIPLITEEIQQQVSTEVGQITGVAVSNVSVFVSNIIQNPSVKRRLE